jgi:hypothetical protein
VKEIALEIKNSSVRRKKSKNGRRLNNMSQIRRSVREALLLAVVAPALVIAMSSANAQVVGAVQYPPASVGQDAQPPPPARMAPQSMSPQRIELGISGPSERPGPYMRGIGSGAPPIPPPPTGGK